MCSFKTGCKVLQTNSLAKEPRLRSGDHKGVAPPVPISNTAVKRVLADGSASIGCARVGCCQFLFFYN